MTRRGVVIAALVAAGVAVGSRWFRPGETLSAASPSASDLPDDLPDDLPGDLVVDDDGRVVGIIDGDTVELADGRQVRLVGTQAPKLALGRKNFTDWPLADESRDVLGSLVDGRSVALAFGGLREDRHGRTLAHLVDPDGRWIQGAMLAAGMSRVYTFADNRAAIGAMLGAERVARADRLGIWDHPYYAVRNSGDLDGLTGRFELVEGRVLHAADARSGTYLNFGRDWSSDFTVFVRDEDRRTFDTGTIDLLSLEDRQIRVRGWLVDWDGPMIEVSHPEQIEVL
ncbi:MAG: thermonuclease family protein [Pseudomonadota bacterium]